jgi:hypothetical protein
VTLLERLDDTVGLGAELAVDDQRLAPEHGVPALGQGVEPGLDLADGAAGRPEPDDVAREARGTGRLDDVGPGQGGPDEVDHVAPVADLRAIMPPLRSPPGPRPPVLPSMHTSRRRGTRAPRSRLGYAQQLFTPMVDERGQAVLAAVGGPENPDKA